MISDSTREKLRLALIAPCIYAAARLYMIIIRLTPRIGSAEPTAVGEVAHWVRLLTHDSLLSIQKRTHGFWYAGEYLGCIAGLFVVYAVIVWLAKGVRRGWFLPVATAGAALFMGLLLFAPAMLSSDTYAYAYYGRLLAVYGVDAHAAAPDYTLADPFLSKGYYQFVPSVYGPLWTVISGVIARIGGNHVGFTLLLFRSFEAFCTLGSAGLISTILRRTGPDKAVFGTILFIWNPLVILESALSGHNDACMMFLAVLAVWLHLRGWKVGTVVALTLSALVKVITAPLIPLYILMIVRGKMPWSQRFAFPAKAALGALAALLLSMLGAKMSPNGLTMQTASSAQFFENNYHELLFKGLRRLLGEHADSIESPMDFRPYWVATNTRAVLHAGTSNKSPDESRLSPEQPLLGISDEDSDDWLRVYDPATHLQGYVDWSYLRVIEVPPVAETDATAQRLSGWPPDWPTVVMANKIIRIVTWGLFIAFGLLAAWKTTDFGKFLFWSTGFFLAAQLLVFTKIWPWYMLWPLAYGALRPGSASMRLAIMLSAGMLTMYALFDFSDSPTLNWINEYRSIPAIVAPVVLFALFEVSRRYLLGNKPLTPTPAVS